MSAPAPKRENLLLNLVFNIAIPTLILTKFSGEKTLGPVWGLVVALAFPVGYGVWDFAQRKQANFVSLIGFASVLLSGGLGLMKAELHWFAIKEAAMPTLIGLAVLFSQKTKRPLVRTFLYNDQVLDVARIDQSLDERGQHAAFDRLLARASYALAFSFLISAVLNYALARYLLQSAPGTEAFNAELGRMNAWSWPVIVVPSLLMTALILWKLLAGLQAVTGLAQEDLFAKPAPKNT